MSKAANESMALFHKLSGLLKDKPRAVQGAALAQALAMWLAGHRVPEEREAVLAMHLESVKSMVPICDAMITAALKTKGH